MTAHLLSPSPVAPATGKKVYASKKVSVGTIFLTANTYKRVPVFRVAALCKIFFRELEFYGEKFRFKLHGYVLMPDHFHLLFFFPPDRDFAAFLRDFKSAVGRLVVDWAEANHQQQLLSRLKLPGRRVRRRDATYTVLQANSYLRPITSPSMFEQKLNYIHDNPRRQRLVEEVIDYPYSSARNYAFGRGIIRVDPRD